MKRETKKAGVCITTQSALFEIGSKALLIVYILKGHG
jgi:hypothetical protein